ncbi:phosphate ABC transporter membrane protein 1, PhoT family [Agreia bicolorata]|uniref:Phosphate transport system permease protein n=1 Tax=Agreia bicolorata TaxID=110935 RepID=A0A1T4XQB2_9MICO|nr:phosphate ABC transporter permease subunit PstC [Agreia bicolorata]SKA91749.1 phosphate ABC transporter membrane protein 1, PhoT family [Agreia bicolorata]
MSDRTSVESVSSTQPRQNTTSDSTTPLGGGEPSPAASPKRSSRVRPADAIFRGLSTGSAIFIMVILAGVALFLIVQGMPAIVANWQTSPELNDGFTSAFDSFWTYVGPLLFGTLWSAAIALVIGAPIGIGIALFISHYAPRRLAGLLGYVVDLLAAVPSVVFGLWGIIVIRPFLLPLSDWLNTYLGWIPIFGGQVTTTGSTILAGAVVLAVMILPIITSISREIFLQTPRLHEEAALALGATRWEMVRLAVFPYAKSGIVSATLLGLGRALGETMAIAMIISPAVIVSFFVITEGQNSQTIAANIALNFPIASTLQRQALIGTGLLLFVVSLAVNMIARYIVTRGSSKSSSKKKSRQKPLVVPTGDATSTLTRDLVADKNAAAGPEGASA